MIIKRKPYQTDKRGRVRDSNLGRVLNEDGVVTVDVNKHENATLTRIKDIKKKFGNSSWGIRIVFNERFGGVLICQLPGQGNRLHYHPDADECWVIMEGEWEWYIEGEGKKEVREGDIVLVKKGTKHQIKCIGRKPGIRFAITKPDVEHVYAERNGRKRPKAV